MRESKLNSIAYELSNLWKYLTRQELCNYYNVTDRTLYNYQSKLKLPKNNANLPTKTKGKYGTNPFNVILKQDKDYKSISFKNWDHFATWIKAQSYQIAMDYENIHGKRSIVCQYTGKEKAESLKYKKKMNLV